MKNFTNRAADVLTDKDFQHDAVRLAVCSVFYGVVISAFLSGVWLAVVAVAA